MATDNARIVKAVYEAFNARDFDALASYAAPDATATSVPFDVKGGFREDFEARGKAFPDARIEVKNVSRTGTTWWPRSWGAGRTPPL